MRAPDAPVAAQFFDGQTAVRHDVSITVHWHTPAALVIEGPAEGLPLRWPLEQLRGLSDQASDHTLIVTRVAETADETPRDPARLVIADPALRDWVIASRPNLFRKDLREGTARKLVVRAIAAVVAFCFILFAGLPMLANSLAPLIPPEREAALGRSTIRQLEFLLGRGDEPIERCATAETDEILTRLVAEMTDTDRYDAPITVLVMDHPMINAFAAPGGHVVFFRGLVDAAESPDEFTAVLAHEIGHVVARDPTRLALRAAGSAGILGLALGDFAGGGAVLLVAQQLIDTSYTRDAEEAADTYAFEAMTSAGVDPSALGKFFARLSDEFGDVDGIAEKFASHPSFANRIEAADAVTLPNARPSMTDAEWAALRAVCS